MTFKLIHLLPAVSVLVILLGSFQNCSKAQFTSESANLSSVAVPVEISDAQVNTSPSTRLKVIVPEVTNIQSDQNVKALFVVDNSATMAYSQKNLADHISILLDKLSQYNTEIQIVSSSYLMDDGSSPAALYKQTSDTKTVQVKGYAGTAVTTTLMMNQFPLFKVNPSQTAAEKQAALTAISNAIKNLGTTGSSSEAPFAVAAMRGLDFFKDGDRGFIFIITDEDDTHSISKLTNPLSTYFETATTNEMIETSFTVYHSTVLIEKHTASGECRGPKFGQDGTIIGYETDQISMVYSSAQACSVAVTSASATCSLSCSMRTETVERTSNSNCNSGPLVPGETILSCSSSVTTSQSPKIVQGASSSTFPFGLTELQIKQTLNAKNLFLNEFKSKVLAKFKDKYLISVVTNVHGQSCALKSGQSLDTFFTSLKAHFPAQNLMINSICNSDSSFAEGLASIAASFERIVASKYLIGLAVGESVESVKIKLPGNAELVSLVAGSDYKVENDQLILLNSALEQFEQLQLKIIDPLWRGI